MRRWMVVGVVVVLVGCGESTSPSDGDGGSGAASATMPSSQQTVTTVGAQPATRGARARPGRTIVLRDSPFGKMLFDTRRQAIYIFENDGRNRSVCYGECAEAWPPVLTRGKPRAGDGVRASLLGTTKRRDGRLQVTYGGKPLYYYAHEEPGEVRCHNVDLNGGFWWVVGADGKRRP